MVDMIRHLVANPCRDACGTVPTGELLDGLPVFRCPGCESQWVESEDTVPGDRDKESGQPSAEFSGNDHFP